MVKDVVSFSQDDLDEMTVEHVLPEEGRGGHRLLLWCRSEQSAGEFKEAGIALDLADVEALIGVLQVFVRNAKEVDGGN